MGFNNLTSEELQKIFMPFAAEQSSSVRSGKMRFAHYTSAYVGLQILSNKEVWLRNSRIMNDFHEIHHGQQCLSQVWMHDSLGIEFRTLLDKLHDGLGERVHASLGDLYEDRNENTFLLSVSEHGDGHIDEDRYGRLSMWRAYGGDVNVALVMKGEPFVGESDALMAFTSPVLYADQLEYSRQFSKVLENTQRSSEKLANTDPEMIFRAVFVALHFAILATKHPGFAEEKEWRLLHSPGVWHSDRLKPSDEVIGGIPQRIFKLPLQNVPERGLVGIEIPELLERVIIGPTQFPMQLRDVFIRKLQECGVPEPSDRVIVSDIPLRR